MAFDFFTKQFVDVIDWVEEPGVLAMRYPMQDREIQNGAQLTVRESQMAAFINEGLVADVFGPGLYTLETSTLPLLTNLSNWDKALASPFKSDVYFFSQRERINFKWGTTQPITIRDKELGPIRIRAFGSYAFRIDDVGPFSVKLMGTLEEVREEQLEPQLRAAIATALATGLGGGDVPFLELAGNQTLLSAKLKEAVTPVFAQWGLAVPSFFVESLSLPEEVQKHFDQATSMRVIGDLDRAGLGGGSGGSGAAQAAEDPFALIERLHKLLTMGAISQEEYDAKKAELLCRIR